MFKDSAIKDYLGGMSYRAVGKKYGVDHKTVRYWVIKNGNKSRTRKEANIIAGKKLRGVRGAQALSLRKDRCLGMKALLVLQRPIKPLLRRANGPL